MKTLEPLSPKELKIAQDSIKRSFNTILTLSDAFPQLFMEKRTITDAFRKRDIRKEAKENIKVVYNAFSKVENTLRDIMNTLPDAEEYPGLDKKRISFEITYNDKINMTINEYNTLKKKGNDILQLYVWISLYVDKIHTLEDYISKMIEDPEKYKKVQFDKIIKEINRIYRQVHIVYDIIEGNTYLTGSVFNKINITDKPE